MIYSLLPFQNRSLFQRFLYTTMSLLIVRQKYYFAWGLTEFNGGAIGCGYTGRCPRTGRYLYEHVRSLNSWDVEAGTSLKAVIDAWNISTTRWLREIFYDRLPISVRTLLVFIISAFWHGFYLGYYVMFLSFALFTTVARIWRKRFRNYFYRSTRIARLYDLFTIILTNFIINYTQASFHLLDLHKGLLFLSSFYYLPHIGAMLILFIDFIYVQYSTKLSEV